MPIKKMLKKPKGSPEQLHIGRHMVEVTHQARIWFPKDGYTKGDIVHYYADIAPIMLPYLKNRAVTMLRYPDGIHGEHWFHKETPDYFPAYIKRVAAQKEGGVVHQPVCNNEAAIVYLANQGCLIFHIWLSKITKLNYPDRLIIDLDPSGRFKMCDPKAFAEVRAVALDLKDLLEDLGLHPFPMLTGSRGMHVVCPLKPTKTFDEVRRFAHDLAVYVAQANPTLLTTEVRKEKRGHRIFLDIARNSYAATGVAPYSVRAYDGAPVAAPIYWEDVQQDSKLMSQRYTITTIFDRLKSEGDAWKDINKHATSISSAQKKFMRLIR